MEYIFETKNLRIRKFEIQDAQQLYENHHEEEVKKWIPNESYADIEETYGAIGFYADCVNNKHLPFVLAVELKENGELIGDTGINEVDGHSNEVEIGYTICQKYSGNGYATELVQEMTKYTCETFGVNIDEIKPHYQQLLEILKDNPLDMVEVYCPLEICRKRNIERENRYADQSKEQYKIMAKNIEYSMRVDTSIHSPRECANYILKELFKDNIGSAKSIINNGGVLENEIMCDGVIEQRYWIELGC